MNKRIRELADQCWISDGGPDSYFSQQKFAELIVREMCQVMKAEVEEFDLDQNFGAVQGIGRCIKVVKQHFGVES